MKKFKYIKLLVPKIFTSNQGTEESLLNKYGDCGWELCHIESIGDQNSSSCITLMREISENKYLKNMEEFIHSKGLWKEFIELFEGVQDEEL